ncbi:MAG: endo-1,4-beta-xylanase [Bryobacteraceae bacterium]
MQRILPAAAMLACGIAWAQLPVSVLPDNPLPCFSIGGPSGSSFSLSIVSVEGQSFSSALHLKSSSSTNAWDIGIHCANTQASQRGDVILASFWMRTTSSARNGVGYTTLVVENKTTYTKSGQRTASAGADWKKVEVPFSMAETYSAGAMWVGFWLAYGTQEIEIGGLSLMNYGQNYPIQSLPGYYYEGHEADAAWRAPAAERIERLRKADIAVVVHDGSGNPVENATVHLKMKRHAFGFGSAVSYTSVTQRPQYQSALLANFNMAVPGNELKWPNWEPNHVPATAMIDWLRQNGIPNVRGHNLIWPDQSHLPADVIGMLLNPPVNQAALRTRINNHIAGIVNFYKGELPEWDVVNEPVSSHDVQDVLGNAEMAVWFQKAREADPAAKLFVNEYNIVENGGYDLTRQDTFYQIVQTILDNGGPLDGIGMQSHFQTDALTPPPRVLEVLDRFALFGKDIEITEFDVNITDEQLQADYTRDFLTASFSHPSIKNFMMWGFWEGDHWRPNAAMFRNDWSTKLNYDVWRNLVYGQWWTDVEGDTGHDGVYRARGFLGDYDVQVTVNGQTQTLPLTVSGGQTNYALVGQQVAGNITAVTNVASYASGVVAPGEMVSIWGSGFGPSSIAYATFENGGWARVAGDTRVLFDGAPAPMIFSVSGQLGVIVPYSVSGTTNIQVEYLGTRTGALAVPVAAAVPGIFCSDLTAGGKGQAVAVNYYKDGTSAFNWDKPATEDSIVSFYITGEGATTPAVVEGKLPGSPWPRPVQPMTITFGGVESTCTDNFVGMVYAGVTQINACVPANAPSGVVPLVVTIGGVSSRSDVTVRIE